MMLIFEHPHAAVINWHWRLRTSFVESSCSTTFIGKNNLVLYPVERHRPWWLEGMVLASCSGSVGFEPDRFVKYGNNFAAA